MLLLLPNTEFLHRKSKLFAGRSLLRMARDEICDGKTSKKKFIFFLNLELCFEKKNHQKRCYGFAIPAKIRLLSSS